RNNSIETPSVTITYIDDGGYFDTLMNDSMVMTALDCTDGNPTTNAMSTMLAPIAQITCMNATGAPQLKPKPTMVSSSTINHSPRVSRNRLKAAGALPLARCMKIDTAGQKHERRRAQVREPASHEQQRIR